MAIVIGPLFSQEARGQFGKTTVYNRRNGQNIVRSYVVPSNPQTANQIMVRMRLAVTGIIIRRVRATYWRYTAVTATFIEFYRMRTRVGEVWNSALVREMQGPGGANYTATFTQYEALAQNIQDLWEAQAVSAIPGLVAYTRGSVTIAAGFMLFLAEKTVAAAGYGSPFNTDAPVVIVNGAPVLEAPLPPKGRK